ncbi:MAG: hypothetical protein ACFCVH_22015 [Alphaproteobacteria bacterium]
MIRLLAGLAVALIGFGAVGLRSYWYDDTSATPQRSTGAADAIAGYVAGFVAADPETEAAAAPTAGVPEQPALALQLSQIQQILEQELAAAAAAEQRAAWAQQTSRDGSRGAAIIAVPPAVAGGCQPDGAAGQEGCTAVTGPASAAQVQVIRPRQ